jgi:hypothetical protein
MISKKEAQYKDVSPDREERRCYICTMFRAPSSCSLVRGKILAEGVCKHFELDKRFDINFSSQPVAKVAKGLEGGKTMPDPMRMYLPLTKVDAVNRLVYGIATEEVPDRAGEIMDYQKSKPYFEAWSKAQWEATNGQSLGNLRAMHTKIAAGKLTELHFNDEAKRIDICAKVVDDEEWKKVIEGVYSGFSIGGSYAAPRVPDTKNPALKRYVADPFEISLVDLPCLPTATFQLIKSIGAVSEVENRPFKKIDNDDGILEAFERFHRGEFDRDLFEKMTVEEAAGVGPDAHVGMPSGRDEQHDPSSIRDNPPPPEEGGGSSDAAPRTPSTAKVPNREGEEDEEVNDSELPSDKDKNVGDPGGPIAGAGEGATHSLIAEKAAGGTATTNTGEGGEDDIRNSVMQVWLAKDGKPFRNKKDALEHTEKLRLAEVAKELAAPTEAAIAALEASLDRVDGGKPASITDLHAHDAAWQAAKAGVQTRAGVNPLGKVYHDVKDLPPAVTDHFKDANKQHQWMDVWNSVYGKKKDEQQAFAEAWAAAEKAPTQAEVEKKAASTPAKYGNVEYADPGFQGDKKRYPVDTEKHIRAAWSYIHMPKNAAKYSSNQVAHIKTKIAGAWKAKVDPEGPPEASKAMGSAFIRMLGENLSKHLYDVGEVACTILRLNDMVSCLEMEAVREGDDAQISAELRANVASLCDFLRNLVEEETKELVMGTEDLTGWADNDDGDDSAVQIFVRAACGANALALAKIFREVIIAPQEDEARVAKAKGQSWGYGPALPLIEAMEKVGAKLGQVNRMHLQAAHDHIAAMCDGESCEGGDTEKWTKAGAKLSRAVKEKLQAAHDRLGELGADCSMSKGAYLFATNPEVRSFEKSRGMGGGGLSAVIDENAGLKEALKRVTGVLTDLRTRVEKIERTPEPSKGIKRTIFEKGAPVMGTGEVPDVGGNGVLHRIEKGYEGADAFSYGGRTGQGAIDEYEKFLNTLTPDQRSIELIKLAQRFPTVQVGGPGFLR